MPLLSGRINKNKGLKERFYRFEMVRTRLSESEKAIIRTNYANGNAPSAIAALLGRSPSTVRAYHSRYISMHGLPEPIIVKNYKIGATMGRAIKQIAAEMPKLGSRSYSQKLAEMLPNEPWYPSKDTIIRFLKRNGMARRVLMRKAPLNDERRANRVVFAQNWLENDHDTLGNVIWSDETTVRSHPLTRRVSIWASASTPQMELPVQEMHHGGSFIYLGGIRAMFWGCISRKGRGPEP